MDKSIYLVRQSIAHPSLAPLAGFPYLAPLIGWGADQYAL